MNVSEKGVIIITGGSGLLGKAFSEACANAGYVVVIADINDEIGRQTVTEIIERTKNNYIFLIF